MPTLMPTAVPTFLPSSAPTPSPTWMPTPTPELPQVRAVRLDFADLKNSRAEVGTLEQKMMRAGVNMVALGAGRLDWNYFKWQGHEDWWSGDVRETGTDFLGQDAARFSKWSHVSAVVDVFAPRYIASHPQAAAVSSLGKRSANLVSTMELVQGDFGNQLLDMLDYIAAHYPVDSISLTELTYYTEGYGEGDKAAYRAYTGRPDWPRNLVGLVNIDDPSIGQWRSYEISRFLEKAAAVVHGHNKQLFIDVEVSWGHLQNESTGKGQDYALLLKSADRLVVWDYFGLSGYRPEYTGDIAHYLTKYDSSKVIISVGLWSKGGGVIRPDALRRAMQAALKSEIPNLWITPSHYLSEEHWKVLMQVWGEQQ
jgi:hypothetical protein